MACSLTPLEVAHIFRASWELHDTFSVHVTFMPLSNVSSAVHKLKSSVSEHRVILELAFVDLAQVRLEGAMTMFGSILILTLESGTIQPNFISDARLHVQAPFALVCGPIRARISSSTMRSIISPLTIIPIPVRGDERAFAMCSIITELALVALPLCSNKYAVAMLVTAKPLAYVLLSVLSFGQRHLIQNCLESRVAFAEDSRSQVRHVQRVMQLGSIARATAIRASEIVADAG
mmetsp:Transcript_58438/g.92370  ORF Transcript_58438/g.92370 Transcript_58438/m.92370 type:complete len:234 (-) Transcript_58438:13-714(-)